jgi:hypothetical protein
MSQIKNKSSAHMRVLPGRIRLIIPHQHKQNLPKDKLRSAFRSMPNVQNVKFSKRSVLIEHSAEEKEMFEYIEEVLKRFYPDNSADWLNPETAPAAVEGGPYPLKSMSIPIVLGVIALRALQTGTLWQGETVFGLAYLVFNSIWNDKHAVDESTETLLTLE